MKGLVNNMYSSILKLQKLSSKKNTKSHKGEVTEHI